MQAYLVENELASRPEILERFRYDDEISVRGILNDLVESGLVVRSGRGEDTIFRVATRDELRDVGAHLDGQQDGSLAALVWLQIYREGRTSFPQLLQLVPVSEQSLEETLDTLIADGRVRSHMEEGNRHFTAEDVLIPVGEAAGWEAAVVDHHRTVLNALAAKITSGNRTSARSDEVGGTTLTFDLWPGHPHEEAVRKLLATTRSSVLPLWEDVTSYNKGEQTEEGYQVHFYFGQYVVEEDKLP